MNSRRNDTFRRLSVSKGPIKIDIALLRRGGRLCPPGRVHLIFAKSCGTYVHTARFGVGVDMPIFGAKSRAMRGCASKLACGHRIDPTECTVYTRIFGESATAKWADRVVGPYGETSISPYLRRDGRLSRKSCTKYKITVF